MRNSISWQVFSDKERNHAINELKNIISVNDGYILNFSFYSDLALHLVVEIDEKIVIRLYQGINEIMKISEPEPESLQFNSGKEIRVYINLSFSSGKGDLKVEVPSVPG